jgi:tellurite methyltransferase
MEIREWEERYRLRERPEEDSASAPVPVVMQTAGALTPGRALDLACGTGRNALWLAEHGWKVTAVDGARTAVEILLGRAKERGLTVDARVADLERWECRIEPEAWDLICICYYLQRDLFEPAKRGVAPGGVLIALVHIAAPGEQATQHRLAAGELIDYFRGWDVIHQFEGLPKDTVHRRLVAEIVASKPRAR